MTYLLDTNTVIYYFKGLGRVADALLVTPPSEVAVATVTLYELEVGLRKAKQRVRRRKQLALFERLIQVWPLGRAEAQAAAEIRAKLELAGRPIGPLDNLIAGIARARGAVLVTHNRREFSRISGLRVEDWF